MSSLNIQKFPMICNPNLQLRSVSMTPTVTFRKLSGAGRIQCNSAGSEKWNPVVDLSDGNFKCKHTRVSKMPDGTIYVDTMLSNSNTMPETAEYRRPKSTLFDTLFNKLKDYGLGKVIEIPIEIVVKLTLRSLAQKHAVFKLLVNFLDDLDVSFFIQVDLSIYINY